MDTQTTISQLKERVEAFVVERDWTRFHTPKNLSMAITVEAAELMELFRWQTETECTEFMRNVERRERAQDELADVIILCLAFANRNGIDVALSVEKKIRKNILKYPVAQFKGRV